MDIAFWGLLALPVLLVWAAVLYRMGWQRRLRPWMSIPVATALVLATGTVLGYDFFHKSVGPLPVTLDRVGWSLLLAALAGAWLTRRLSLPSWNRIDVAVLMLLVIVTASTLSHDFRVNEKLPLTRLIFFVLMPCGYYLLGRSAPLNRQDLVACSVIWIGLSTYLALTGICEVRGWHSLVWPRHTVSAEFEEFFGRARGPLLNPVANGMLLLLGLCSALLYWRGATELLYRRRSASDDGHTVQLPSNDRSTAIWRGLRSLRGQIGVLGIAAIASVGCLATLTRSVWLGVPLAGCVFVWLPANRLVKGGLLLVGLAGLMALLAATNGGQRFKRDANVTASEMAESVSLRPILAQIALKMFADRPLTGHGFGQYSGARKTYVHDHETALPLQKGLLYLQHNVFLSFLVDMGLLGLLGLLLVLGLIVWESWLVASEHPDPLFRGLGMTALVMVGGWSINGMFHDVSIISGIGATMFFLFGLINRAGEEVRLIHCAPAPQTVAAVGQADSGLPAGAHAPLGSNELASST